MDKRWMDKQTEDEGQTPDNAWSRYKVMEHLNVRKLRIPVPGEIGYGGMQPSTI